MTAYREVINNETDLQKVFEILKNLKQRAEIIILPLENTLDNKDFINAQNKSLKSTWDNPEDKVWDEL